ncbi:unnamed protein product, partial [Mesorhabditis belari]|uniref:Nuclear receptor domain-containing protein n=1 Tax=Mesorhabditis belari TaxID=2138241 RepID=A0AAF3EX09_9BILA
MWDAVCYSNPLAYLCCESDWPMPFESLVDGMCQDLTPLPINPMDSTLNQTTTITPYQMYQYALWPFAFTSNDETRGSEGSSSQDKALSCTVCADAAEGFHFGAVACAACGAFFRRSVSDQKVYSCAHRKCNVRFDSAKRGGICRYCRFEKCLSVGMLPQEVQAKRARRSEASSTSSASPRPTPVNRRKGASGVLESIVALRREIASARTRIYNQEEAEPEPQCEAPEHWAQLGSCRLRELFLLYVSFEMALSTSTHGGVQMDRCALYDGSNVELTEESLRQFFADDSHNRDPDCLTRLSIEFYDHLVRVCSRSLQAAHLDEMEIAYVFYACLAHAAPAQNVPPRQMYATLAREIGNYYETGGAEVGVKMGGLSLLLSPLFINLFHLKEFTTVVELLGGTWMPPQ